MHCFGSLSWALDVGLFIPSTEMKTGCSAEFVVNF